MRLFFLPAQGITARHTAGLTEAPAFGPEQRGPALWPCGCWPPWRPAPGRCAAAALPLSLQCAVLLTWNPLPAFALLLYLNLWKLISACFLGIYTNAGRCGFYLWIGEIPLDKEMATHTIIPPSKAHGWRNLVGDIMGFQRVRHDLVTQQ